MADKVEKVDVTEKNKRLLILLIVLLIVTVGLYVIKNNMEKQKALEKLNQSAQVSGNSIFDVISNNPDYSKLKEAILTAGMESELMAKAPHTFFAPTNQAFLAIPADVQTNPELMRKILSYHLISGKVMSKDLVNSNELTSLQGNTLIVVVDADGSAMVNNAKIEKSDTVASNGVVHQINTVLLPQE